VYIAISNDETYVFKKTDNLDKVTKRAHEVIVPTLIALGLKPKRTHIFISTEDPRVYELAVKLSTKFTMSTINATFGFTHETNPGAVFYSVVQVAHILFPQLRAFGGPRPTVVPVGIDQDPYMRIARDAAEKIGLVKPSSTYNKFMWGLKEPGGKMSGSKPETAIFLTDTPEQARKKIMGAFSGGAASLAEHKKHGGNPDMDVACHYLYYMFETSDKKVNEIIENFRTGKLSSGDVKSILADKVTIFLRDFQKKFEKAKSQTDKFMIEGPKGLL
ncbi:tryptophan--tRNA ligase, partial [Candidatus Woesearchaeota archaeon]|nr:tryptophan--tRNA ligase [Candidatus Woesearchaeota archaeon]